MEPCAPGTEDDPPIMYSTLTKQENEQERLLSLKAILKNGKYDNIFELSYVNGVEHWYCRACECPVMGRVFQHEVGKRHNQSLATTNRHFETQRQEEPAEEVVSLEIAPGEPVPPGFEEEVGRSSQIQERLDGFKVGPLVALEYLLELQDDDISKEPLYLCILCDKRGDPRTVLTHLASYNHISQYLQKHFPTCWRALAPYMTKQYKRNWQITLQKIAEGIEKKFGRLKPYPIEKDKFDKDRMHYLQIVVKGKHFSERSGYTFEELIVHDELTKSLEDEKSYESSSVNNWGSTFIQKPFKKKDPSPPVVGLPFSRKKGNAQTNPRKQEPAYVPPSQKQTPKAQAAGKPVTQPQGKAQVPASSQGTRPVPKSDQRRRRSLSSVSSISSSELNDDDGKSKDAHKFDKKREPPQPQRNERSLPYSRRRSPIPNRRQPSPRRRSRSPRRRSPSPRRRSPSPRRRRSPTPRRRSPFPRRRSPSPRRDQRNVPVQKHVDKKTEQEQEQIRKIEEYRKLARAIENDLQKTLKQHEKNPEKHPQYNEEWKKFWNRRYKELKAEGVDVAKHDFKPEWIEFWNKRMVELHSDEVRNRKDALRRRLALPEKINPIKFTIGAPAQLAKTSPKRLPMAAQPDQDDEVILIDDKDDDVPSLKRSRSPWEEDMAAKSKSSEKRRSLSPRTKRSRDKSPARRSRSRDRYSDVHSRSRSRDRSTSVRSRDVPRSKEFDRERNSSRSKEFERGRDYKGSKDAPKRSRSRERSWERKDSERKRMPYRESSFERDLRAKERVRTVADLPWEREKAYRVPIPMEEFYKPPPIMRDATRKPVIIQEVPRNPVIPKEGSMFLPEEEDDDGEVNVVDVLRILTALEERLGSLGPKVIDLLAQALALEKKEANSSEALLDNDINCVLFETVKEKLKGQMLAGLVDLIQERAFKKAIKKIAGLIHLAGQRKRQREKLLPKVTPVSVPGIGTVDKAAIAKQIANALVAQGKTDVTQAELEQLINAVVGMAEASKNSNKPVTTANFLQQLAGGNLLPSPTKTDPVSQEKTVIPSSAKKEESVSLEKLTEPLTPSSGKNSVSNMENLSDSDLQTLLQNFKDLCTDEQHNLINYLKKLELQEPERVERLRKFVNLDPTGKGKDEESTHKGKKNRESPFSNRLGSLNPTQDDLVKIESDEEDMKFDDEEKDEKEPAEAEKKSEKTTEKVHEDSEEEDYTFEDVVKTVSKNVKDNEMAHSKKIVEESMKFENSKAKPELSSAKDLISNLMGSISKTTANSGNIDLLGLGVGQPSQNPSVNAPSTMASSIDFSAFSSINVASLTSIVNNVKSMTSTNSGNKPLDFEASPTARTAGKLYFNPGNLDKPSVSNIDLSGSRTELGLGPRGDQGRNFSAANRGFEEPLGLDRGTGRPGFEGPGRGFERDRGGPDRGYERDFRGPDRPFDRDLGGPVRDFDRGPMGQDRGPMGQDRGPMGQNWDPMGQDRGPMGQDRVFNRGPDRDYDRTFRGPMEMDRTFDRPMVGADRRMVPEERNFGGPDRGFGVGSGPDRPLGGVGRGFDREAMGPDRGFGGSDNYFNGRDRGFDGGYKGPERPFGGPGGSVGGNRDSLGPRGGPSFASRDNMPFGDQPSQRLLPRPGGGNPRFGGPGPDYGRGNNFNRW
ncbi:uncharacterized protein CG7065 isoform X1 [Leptinotarsa decemlineata]|uniref:uncharacterized protein CG7065 isoform X1 n=3 Tax=Leptinotarsa decemlineata TaxID=7539 RepID=UPI003D306D13